MKQARRYAPFSSISRSTVVRGTKKEEDKEADRLLIAYE